MIETHWEQGVYHNKTLHGVDQIIAFHSNLETVRRHETPTLSRDLSFVLSFRYHSSSYTKPSLTASPEEGDGRWDCDD